MREGNKAVDIFSIGSLFGNAKCSSAKVKLGRAVQAVPELRYLHAQAKKLWIRGQGFICDRSAGAVLVAVDPDTLEVLDDIPLPEPSTVPHSITMFEGRIAIYLGMNSSARRAFWDPVTKKLSLDESWVIHPMQKGQTTATAPALIGDWVGFQLNGIGSYTVD